jgi:hypothetical protein
MGQPPCHAVSHVISRKCEHLFTSNINYSEITNLDYLAVPKASKFTLKEEGSLDRKSHKFIIALNVFKL